MSFIYSQFQYVFCQFLQNDLDLEIKHGTTRFPLLQIFKESDAPNIDLRVHGIKD